jgi:hypothetical protein
MALLFELIQQLVSEDKYVVGEHAVEKLEERGILEWQVVAGLADVRIYLEQPDAKPNPKIEVIEHLPDGTEIKVVWSHLRQANVAKLVTAHFFDEK